MKTELSATMGDGPEKMGQEDYSITAEEFLDRNFGPGTWVRDPFDDVFIVFDAFHPGPGRSYTVIDRSLRRQSTVIPANMVN